MCAVPARPWTHGLAPAELNDAAAITLAGAALGNGSELLHGFALLGGFLPRCLAGVGFAIEGLGHSGGSAHFAQREHFHLEFAALIADVEHVSDMHVAGGLGLDVAR